MAITFNNSVYATGFAGEDDGAPSASFALDNLSTNSITVNGTVAAVGDRVTVTGLLPGSADSGNTATTNTLYVTQFDNSGMIEFSDSAPANQNANSFRYVLSNSALTARQRVTFNTDTGLSGYQPACFTTGTLIRTARGEVAVEALAVGDVVVTASGRQRPVVWIGSRHQAFDDRAATRTALPVRIRAGAVAPGVPARDLVVSPDHSLFLDDVFVPAKHLVNGASITRDAVASVTYWHVELESHDVLLSEGMASESYLDVGNRGSFQSGRGAGDTGARAGQDFCAPVVRGGERLRDVRAWLIGRAQHLGWRITLEPGLQLVADGAPLTPTAVTDDGFAFEVPHGTRDLRLASRGGVLSEVLAEHPDERRLGVMLVQLSLDGQDVSLDDERLSEGFHAFEAGAAWRWTDGDARLPLAAQVAFRVRPAVYVLDSDVRVAASRETAADHAGPQRLRLVG